VQFQDVNPLGAVTRSSGSSGAPAFSPDIDGSILLEFHSHQAAETARRQLQGRTVLGRAVRVTFVRRTRVRSSGGRSVAGWPAHLLPAAAPEAAPPKP
jgi:hypothetical protein